MPEKLCIGFQAAILDRTLRFTPETIVHELDVVKQRQEHFTYLSEAEVFLAVRTFLDKNTGRFESFEASEAVKRVACNTLMGIGRHLIANNALEHVGPDLNALVAITA